MSTVTPFIASVLLLAAAPAWAAKTTKAPSKPQPVPAAEPDRAVTAAEPDQPARGALDFNLFDEPGSPAAGVAASDADAITDKARTRRSRLRTHQVLGGTTWTVMAATAVVGQLNYNDSYGSGAGSGKWLWPHRILSYSTALLFAGTATFALIAPEPYERPLALDTALLHRIAVVGATAGLLTQVVLGFMTARQADAGNSRDLKTMAKTHQIVGYATLGFLTLAGAVWLF